VKCYTLEGAYATKEEHFKGSIEPGKMADITILPIDITAKDFKLDTKNSEVVDAEKPRIKSLKAYMTILDGEIVYIC